jgi:hypothetical protein
MESQATVETFTKYLNLPYPIVESMLRSGVENLTQDPEFQRQLNNLDTALLKETLPTAKEVMVDKLPAFYDWLQNELGIQRVPDSPNHTTTWVTQFLKNQESIQHLVELHRPVPPPSLEQAIPRLVGLFDAVDDDRVRWEWQRAIAILCAVLSADAREQDQKQQLETV